ncbi:NUDIX domain-containing protein [Candidatus Woesearchaeota archaeon]|jgi:isopentenyldiphosphate isomerase|nr:NUDIX domain-containing protein [Candidatus Woesearchaeota archaeon]MBT3538004.1 NUDIX domain-containing protein [Candidatus Woesearchaeota archaeon]MBT4697358.1 NUDIX domain-containing protein [Candidatus Woesearchaeota archaeon]MBT4717079.1 NUDIX domain-containing protein [Candidatus Woesearchaeota archaeon]MBT7105673.1 NUDIX domain-containing protein [Candidatus Woesearchaeota archaeon]
MTELIEEIDWDGNLVAKRPIAELKERMFPHKVSLVIPKGENNKFIFAMRAKDKHPFPNTWTCGIGGKVSAEESYEQAALREFKEEASVSFDVEKVAEFKYDEDHYKAIFSIFTTKNEVDINVFKPDPREVQYFEAISLDEISKIVAEDADNCAPTFIAAVKAFISGLN